MHPDRLEQEDQDPHLQVADQSDPDPHVKVRIRQQQPQPMMNFMSRDSLQVDRSKFDIEEEKKGPEPQQIRYLDLDRDFDEIAQGAYLALNCNLKRLLEYKPSKAMLAALEQAMCGVGLYCYTNGQPNKELRKRVVNDLRYCITTSLCVPDINEYMAFKLHHEFERKELVTDGESWQRLCVLINPRNQRIYHNLSSAFIVLDSNHEGHLTSFTCGQLHYGPLFRAGSLMNITKGPMTSQILHYLLSAINLSRSSVRFNPLVQQWDLSLLSQFDGVGGNDNKDVSLMPFVVFTIDMPALYMDTVCAMIRSYFQHAYPEDYFINKTFDYELLKINLPQSITEQVWAVNQ